MEQIDIVDKNDKVLYTVSRKEMYEKQLRHRIVHVLVYCNGKIGLQKRTMNMSWLPGGWTSTAGGHVSSGESHYDAAKRELKEEIGLDSEITLMFKCDYVSNFPNEKGLQKKLGVFKTEVDKEFTVNNREVDFIQFFTLDEIKELIIRGDLFNPELTYILEKYFF